ncbi:MAG: hypothetical protein QXX95_02565 [Nitrososphaerales archaeon]
MNFKGLKFWEKEPLKPKISNLINELEFRRLELDHLGSRLEMRRKTLFSIFMKTLERGEGDKALVLASEYNELSKLMELLRKSSLALTRIKIRLESVKDMGDFLYHMDNALKTLKKFESFLNLSFTFEKTWEEIASFLNEALLELKVLSPQQFGLKINSERILKDELIESRSLEVLPQKEGLDKDKEKDKIPLLADGDELYVERSFKPKLFKRDKELVQRPLEPINQLKGDITIADIALELKLPVEEVEQALIRLYERKNKPVEYLQEAKV